MKHLIPIAGIAMLVTSAAHADPSQDYCAAYAKRAVDQYQQMKSTPGCDAHLDALSWRDDYAYHYNGCMTFGKFAAKISDQGRDGHLRACGAIGSAGTAANNSTTAPTGANAAPAGTTGSPDSPAAAAMAAPAAPTSAGTTDPSKKSAPASGGVYYPYAGQGAMSSVAVTVGVTAAPLALVAPAQGYGEINCAMPPALQFQLTGKVVGFGLATQISGAMLTYHGSPIVSGDDPNGLSIAGKAQLGEYPLETTLVARPSFYSTCKGIPHESLLGPWVAPSGSTGPRYFWVSPGGGLEWRQLTPDAAKAFMGEAPSTATPAKSATASHAKK